MYWKIAIRRTEGQGSEVMWEGEPAPRTTRTFFDCIGSMFPVCSYPKSTSRRCIGLESCSSPMSRDGFHRMLAADWPAASKEIAIHGRTGKSKPDPSRLKAGKLKPVQYGSSFFRKKFISIGWPWHGPLIWSFPWKYRLWNRLSFWLTRICWLNDMLESTKKSFSKRANRGKAYRFWFEHGWRSRSKFQCDNRWSSRWCQVDLEKVRWSSESTRTERSWSDRKNFLRSPSRQQQMPETILILPGRFFSIHTHLFVRSS